MCWIIAAAQGPLTGATSNYYAALNLILLAVSVVVRWDIWESTFCVGAIILMYLAACGFHWLKPTSAEIFQQSGQQSLFPGTDRIIVIVGNHFFTGCDSANSRCVTNWTRAARRWKRACNNSRKTRCNWCRPRSWRRSAA